MPAAVVAVPCADDCEDAAAKDLPEVEVAIPVVAVPYLKCCEVDAAQDMSEVLVPTAVVAEPCPGGYDDAAATNRPEVAFPEVAGPCLSCCDEDAETDPLCHSMWLRGGHCWCGGCPGEPA